MESPLVIKIELDMTALEKSLAPVMEKLRETNPNLDEKVMADLALKERLNILDYVKVIE
jgi:ribosomal protein L20